ncbi:MAG: hypothetical protein LBC87_08330 [Fibromonadaceae bacterium]|jgi:hypothetical protein|nr:hypothetical protein [Fibromonadaceae bacterium]
MFRLLILFAIFSVIACAGGKRASRYSSDPERVNDVMITFVQRAQAGFWKEAMENVSLEERADMMEGTNVMQEYKDAVNRIRLSTIKHMDLGLDRNGRLVGLKDILDESNERYVSSSEKVVIDPSKLEDRGALRQKREEEEARKAALEPVKEEKNSWLDVYYGNTKSGGGGRLIKEKPPEDDED